VGMAVQADGKVLLVGGLKLVRLNVNGTMDASFGASGVVNVVFKNGAFDTAMDTAVQTDGKIVVAGTASTPKVGSDDFAVTRYNSDGTVDGTFGANGLVVTDFFGSTDQASRLKIQADGKILVSGTAFDPVTPSTGVSLFALARYSTNGALDTTFNTDGKFADAPAGPIASGNAFAIQSDGRIVIAGSTRASGGDDPDTAFMRLLGDGQIRLPGTPDDTFGPLNNGALQAPLGGYDEAVDVVTLDDGTILAAINVNAGVTTGGLAMGFGVAHIPPSGSPTPHFPQPVINFTTTSDTPSAMLKQTDGKIVVVGQSGTLGANPDMAIARFDSTGFGLDPGFGTGGKLTLDFLGGRDAAQAVAQAPDGKLLVGGYARSGAGNVLAAVRLAP
jgi:uncharacterized delta-60 repeat protein